MQDGSEYDGPGATRISCCIQSTCISPPSPTATPRPLFSFVKPTVRTAKPKTALSPISLIGSRRASRRSAAPCAGITAATRRKTPKVSKGEVEEPAEEMGHDPLANLRKLEQSRPGFHYRGTENLDVLVHGRRESREQNKRWIATGREPRFISLLQGKSWKEPGCFCALSVLRVQGPLPTCRGCGHSEPYVR